MSSEANEADPAVQPAGKDIPEYRDWYDAGVAKKKSPPRNIDDKVAVTEEGNNTATGLKVHDVKEVKQNGKKVKLYQLKRKNGELHNDGNWYAQDRLLDDD